MENIISPVPLSLILEELTPERKLRDTHFAGREIYVINGNHCPNVMREIGRLREISFRDAGGGSGKAMDVDNYDLGQFAYHQLVLWEPEAQEIVGGYRFAVCMEHLDEDGIFQLSTSEIVAYSDKLEKEYFPYTIELGRSYIQPKYQATGEDRRNIYGMDNLWDGLGAISLLYPQIKYFFGKITMYSNFNKEARDILLAFMHHYFPDNEHLVIIPQPLKPENDTSEFIETLKALPYLKGYVEMNRMVRSLGENIPPLFNAYMKLSPTMRTLGTAVNEHFGYVEETGIIITKDDIYPDKKERYTQHYQINPLFTLPTR